MDPFQEDLNKIVRAIGSFIFTCLLFACPIVTAFMLQAKHMNFLIFILFIASIIEFIFVLGTIYLYSE